MEGWRSWMKEVVMRSMERSWRLASNYLGFQINYWTNCALYFPPAPDLTHCGDLLSLKVSILPLTRQTFVYFCLEFQFWSLWVFTQLFTPLHQFSEGLHLPFLSHWMRWKISLRRNLSLFFHLEIHMHIFNRELFRFGAGASEQLTKYCPNNRIACVELPYLYKQALF